MKNKAGVATLMVERLSRSFSSGGVGRRRSASLGDDDTSAADGSSGTRRRRRDAGPSRDRHLLRPFIFFFLVFVEMIFEVFYCSDFFATALRRCCRRGTRAAHLKSMPLIKSQFNRRAPAVVPPGVHAPAAAEDANEHLH